MAENKLSWTELRRALASRAGVSEKEANAFLSAFNAQLIEALKADKQVKINGLGTFKLQAVAPRKSVNVKTGEEITIEGYNKIAFVPEAGVKELVESNGERRMANGEQTDNASKPEVDPLKKLGAQAEEIVDILGELGQSPNGEGLMANGERLEAKVEEPAKPQEEPVKEPVKEPEVVVAPTPEPTPTPSPVPAKPKKKYHFLRDTLICVVILLALLFAGYFFLRHQLSSWIDSLVNKTEVVVEAKGEGLEAKGEGLEAKGEGLMAKGEGLMAKVEEWFAKGKGLMVKGEGLEAKGEEPVEIEEEPIAEEPVVEEPVVEEPKPTVKAEPYQELLLTEEITYGSRLAWIAKKYYGDKAYWPYLYDANRDRITNPSAIPVGTQIRVPKLSAAQRDTTSAAFQALKEEAYSAVR